MAEPQNRNSHNVTTKIWNCIPCRIAAVAAAFILGLLLALWILTGPVLNHIVKPRITEAVNKNGRTLHIEDLSLNPFTNKLYISGIRFNSSSDTDSVNSSASSVNAEGISWFKLLFGKGLNVSAISVNSPSASFAAVNSGSPGSSKFDFSKLDSVLKQMLPSRLKPFTIGSIHINDGFIVQNTNNPEGSASDSVKGVNIIINNISLSDSSLPLGIAESVSIKISGVNRRNNANGYALKIDSLFVSTADSSIKLTDFSFEPFLNIDGFFKLRSYSSDMLTVKLPSVNLSGVNFNSLFRDNSISVQQLETENFKFEALTNKVLPDDLNAEPPQMPHKLLNDLGMDLQINTLLFKNGTITYKRLFDYAPMPAELNFTSVYATISDINNTGSPVQISAQSKLAGAGLLKVDMRIPVDVSNAVYTYKGSLGGMDAAVLNKYLKISDLIIIESGWVDSVTFSASAENNLAVSSVTPVYSDLKFKQVSKDDLKTDFLKGVKSTIADLLIINNDNNGSSIKSGNGNYRKERMATFFDYIWIPLRNGLGKVIGFN